MAEKRRCINCGHAMKQQFIGLKHCKCGISWKKDIGYFERTRDMGCIVKELLRAGKEFTFHSYFYIDRSTVIWYTINQLYVGGEKD